MISCTLLILFIMYQPGRPIFGIQKLNRRYSTPNNWKGGKLSAQSMNKTMSLKLKKINAIRSARSHHQFYIEDEMNQIRDEEFGETRQRQFFKTHSRVFRGKACQKKTQIQKNSLYIDTKNATPHPKNEEEEVQTTRPVFYSSNLQEKMNLYLNGLLNRSEQQHANKIKEIQLKLDDDSMLRKPSTNLQNLFWRKMKRFNSQKRQELNRQEKVSQFVPIKKVWSNE